MTTQLTEHAGPFTEEEELAQASVRAFLDRELNANYEDYVGNPDLERDLWRKAGQAGILGVGIPEEYGGPGGSDLFGVIVALELGRSVGGTVIGSSITADAGATHVLMSGASEEHKHRWSPGIMTGEVTQAFAITEPEAGSDVMAIKTRAVREGDAYIINGTKVFISNANKADLIYVAAKTDLTQRGRGMSMFIVEGDSPGLTRRRMNTMGYPAYDLAELYFDDVRVPAANLLVGEGQAMGLMMSTFALDRLEMGARALGEAELALRLALEHVKTRDAFGQKVFEFQNTQFVLADIKTEIEVGRAFLHQGIRKYRAGNFTIEDGSMLKLWLPEMTSRAVDRALQLFGGSGFIDEMPIARLYRGSRLHRLYAGTSEIQRLTIGRAL